MPAARRRLLIEATFCLALARLLLLLLPFRRVAPLLGEHMKTAPPVTDPILLEQAQTAGQAVETAARHVPWTVLCLTQAVAATLMLRRRTIPYTVYLGVRKGAPDPIQAHAWVRVGPQIVNGRQELSSYTIVSRFDR